jgi:hypothetical protein
MYKTDRTSDRPQNPTDKALLALVRLLARQAAHEALPVSVDTEAAATSATHPRGGLSRQRQGGCE